jgi:hypothetical protein
MLLFVPVVAMSSLKKTHYSNLRFQAISISFHCPERAEPADTPKESTAAIIRLFRVSKASILMGTLSPRCTISLIRNP